MTTAYPTGHNTTADLIEDAAQRYAAKTFIHDSGRELSFETVFM